MSKKSIRFVSKAIKRLLTALCLLTLTAEAQQFVMLPLPNQQKLPQSEVYRVFQDSEGYMWYATRGAGLCRDNGYQIDVFRSDRYQPDLLRSNVVTCIAENPDRQEIWFGTKQGAYVLSKRDYTIRTLPNVQSDTRIIVRSSDGAMWVAVRKQVKVFSCDGEPIDSFALSWKGRPMSAESMMIDSRGVMWVMQWDGGVQTIDTRTRQLQTMNWDEPVGPTSLAEDSVTHQYFIGTWGRGVYRYDGQTATHLDLGLTTGMQQRVRSVCYDKWRRWLWVVTMAGLYAYELSADGQSLTAVPTSSLGLPPEQAVFQLMFDRQGYVWVAGTTPHTFILRPTGGKWMKRHSLDALTRQVGVRLPVDKLVSERHYCWMWSDRTQLVLYDTESQRLTLANGRPDEGTTRFGDVMARRYGGGIWCSSGRQLYVCRYESGQVRLEPQTALRLPDPVSALIETPDGQLFIGTTHSLYRYNLASQQLDTLGQDLRTVREMAVDKHGTLFFICQQHGLCRLKKDAKTFEPIASYERFTSLALDRDDHLWVGNAYGDVWQADSVLHYCALASSRAGNGVKRMLCDSLGHLWVMGDTYLVEYHSDGDRRRLFHSYEQQIGLDNFGGISLNDEGNVVVVGSGGMITFEPKHMPNSILSPLPAVAAYVIDGQKRLLSKEHTLIDVPASVVKLDLELTDFSYLKAAELQFAYRLKGLSDQWIELPVGENTLQLVNLSKGRYTLELKVCDVYGHWGEAVKVLAIDRLPAWWETWWAYACYLLIVVAIAALVIRVYLQRSKEKTQRQMDEQLAEMKLRFFTNVSHELRTPLSLIITPLESIVKRLEKSEEKTVSQQLKGVQKHAGELLSLVNRLLDFRKMDMGEMKLKPSTGDLLEFLRNSATTFEPIATAKGLQFHVDIPAGALYTEFDSQAMQHVVYNLLSNALKFTDEGDITVKVSRYSGNSGESGETAYLTLSVSDTGKGIDAAELPHIFDRYYQARNADDTRQAGSGIGLNMVKELVEQMGGSVSVKSTVGKGTSFTVELPVTSISDEPELPAEPVIPKLPTVLVADDNDDFRDFLVQELKDDYNILQARNGREALRMARTHYVDVILSDVMMPQMDGNELCRQLKQDEATSHIQIILLTAKTAEESRLEGYEAGADDYLTKPFSLELLKNRLNRMAQREQERVVMLAKVEQQEEKEAEEQVRISPVDRKFMTKMRALMEQHVSDTSFSVDVFCEEMGMSRMNFYRKMHALTGQPPAQYINDYRLALADKLLHEGELNVTEIADRTGFSSASYFSKCYKAKYGVAPKDVRLK